jgi:hypothetical protein
MVMYSAEQVLRIMKASHRGTEEIVEYNIVLGSSLGCLHACDLTVIF